MREDGSERLVLGNGQSLVALECATGERTWVRAVGQDAYVSGAGVLLLGGGNLARVSAVDGEVTVRAEGLCLEPSPEDSAWLGPDSVLHASHGDARFRELSPDTLEVRGEVAFPAEYVPFCGQGFAIEIGDTLYMAMAHSGGDGDPGGAKHGLLCWQRADMLSIEVEPRPPSRTWLSDDTARAPAYVAFEPRSAEEAERFGLILAKEAAMRFGGTPWKDGHPRFDGHIQVACEGHNQLPVSAWEREITESKRPIKIQQVPWDESMLRVDA